MTISLHTTEDCSSIVGRVYVDIVVAARPNFIKIGRLVQAFLNCDWCALRLVHTGQHYDTNMSQAFFDEFALPRPDVHLGVGAGSHGEQTGRTLIAYESVCRESMPDWTIVVGDVNATIACALAASKLGIRIAHLEAGLRSRDRSMPEEKNRVLTDAIADLLWTPSEDADANLLAEGIPADRIDRVGNIMIDTLEYMRPKIIADGTRAGLGLAANAYAVATFHRPSNVDDEAMCRRLVESLEEVSRQLPIVIPLHPRTRKRMADFGLLERFFGIDGVLVVEPLAYTAFMNLVFDSGLVITDSGGLQEETTYLGISCLTLRANTERPITITEGTNRLGSLDCLAEDVKRILAESHPARQPPELWDGQTASRVVASLERRALV